MIIFGVLIYSLHVKIVQTKNSVFLVQEKVDLVQEEIVNQEVDCTYKIRGSFLGSGDSRCIDSGYDYCLSSIGVIDTFFYESVDGSCSGSAVSGDVENIVVGCNEDSYLERLPNFNYDGSCLGAHSGSKPSGKDRKIYYNTVGFLCCNNKF